MAFILFAPVLLLALLGDESQDFSCHGINVVPRVFPGCLTRINFQNPSFSPA